MEISLYKGLSVYRNWRKFLHLGGVAGLVSVALACENYPQVYVDDDDFGASEGLGGETGTSTTGRMDSIDLGEGGAPPKSPDAECGNGELELGELCDDGGTEDGDGCSADCLEQDASYDCSQVGEPCLNLVVCGNGVLEGNEACDDGGTDPADGCSADCSEVSDGWVCPRPGKPCVLLPECGNGVREQGEQCDDGQTTPEDGDGCSAQCQLEDGFFCQKPGEPCVAVLCGDGSRTPGEQCDDENSNDGDGCSASCAIEEGYRCGASGCAAVCGDGLVRGSEDCDDAGRASGDGCSGACKEEPFFACSDEPSVCNSIIECGNSIVEPGEICDPPGVNGCSPGCKSFSPNVGEGSSCGNSIIEAGEACDPPAEGNGCSLGCTVEDGWACPYPGVCFEQPRCGDGVWHKDLGETCDDGNSNSADGCDNCNVTPGWSCSGLGPSVCVQEVCGDLALTESEECEDGNATSGDGCTNCKVDDGWVCPSIGDSCIPKCNDGVLTGFEECEDGNADSEDGCSSSCVVEPGYVCSTEIPMDCWRTTCGDGVEEGSEACDDGNGIWGDGCDPLCQLEPSFEPDGEVILVCGDGLQLPGETCDDGNTVDGDGCSADCTSIEDGFVCTGSGNLPPYVDLPLVIRDFSEDHSDMQRLIATEKGIPGALCTSANAPNCGTLNNGRPQLSPSYPSTGARTIANAASYDQWYRDVEDVNIRFNQVMRLDQVGTGSTYEFDNSSFWPIDGLGFGNEGNGRNFHFTSEVRYYFEYLGGEQLNFRGDDDVWVFVNGKLAVDLGGVHGAQSGSVLLGDQDGSGSISSGEEMNQTDDRFGIEKGKIYQIVVFQAERHTTESNYRLTLANFVGGKSLCTPTCGDGVVVRGEVCDDGEDGNGGGYGECNETCSGRTFCGDGILQTDEEECDNGANLDLYENSSQADLCAPGCVLPPTCGDSVVHAAVEECDNGALNDNGAYGPTSCRADCTFGGYCGDGVVNGNESCDDGIDNGTTYGPGSCGYDCQPGPRCGDGVRNGAEECDGSANCGADCTLEPYCGDGVVSSGETCDYGQFASDEYGGCNGMCSWGPNCGDGVEQSEFEECDFGWEENISDYNGCTDACTLGPFCGDGAVQEDAGEVCDNGFNDDTYAFSTEACGAGCSAVPYCGDGTVQSDYELCDEGDDNSDSAYNGCTTSCEWGPYCGDGVKDPSESCDEGADNTVYASSAGGCGYDCESAPYCGDGERNGPEQCDLGEDENTGEYGGCNADCTRAPYCGDGVIQANLGEGCDDGPTGSLFCSTRCENRGVK